MRRKDYRAGYAMLLVLVFMVLFFSLLTLGNSQLGSLLRTETHRVQRLEFDQGPAAALAAGLTLLETGYPSSTPYACYTVVETSTGPQFYSVTFARQPDLTWSVTAEPVDSTTSLPAMPAALTSQTPPP
jgi:hypothetical protein